ncbi:hypothetical protein GCM10027413_05670 [Conyzicola nivalis]|uniref:Cardiolipin synthase N-terminal domain-containing protein n=1 Tax=Conyzicola nivalis TaxID=1477021 RepID=A0A916WK99_9MICO|nr:PLDc N-terminal domain-containing protein [Conyzicola nivalis]GGB06059.1 hypothetical protein GCM10010979_20960 [Conyzicola nivalis]
MVSDVEMWHEMSLGDDAMVDFDHPVDRIIAGLLAMRPRRRRTVPPARLVWAGAAFVLPIAGSLIWLIARGESK